jgi:AraC family ethanolamine operon transcriptional activator
MLVCNPPGEPIDGCITPGFSCLAINVPVLIWEQCRVLAGVDRSFGSVAALHLSAPVYRRIERQIQAVRGLLLTTASAPECRALAIEEVKAFIVSIVTTAWELSGAVAPPLDSVRNRMRLARRAESWMRAHLAEAVRVPDVCLALHVSRRELEYAFHLAFDQSPRDFLHALRLNAIRRTLQRGDARIIQAALDHGITHLGRLAGGYRQLFGEAPSETVRSARPAALESRENRRR